jgi:hypothetical protein
MISVKHKSQHILSYVLRYFVFVRSSTRDFKVINMLQGKELVKIILDANQKELNNL